MSDKGKKDDKLQKKVTNSKISSSSNANNPHKEKRKSTYSTDGKTEKRKSTYSTDTKTEKRKSTYPTDAKTEKRKSTYSTDTKTEKRKSNYSPSNTKTEKLKSQSPATVNKVKSKSNYSPIPKPIPPKVTPPPNIRQPSPRPDDDEHAITRRLFQNKVGAVESAATTNRTTIKPDDDKDLEVRPIGTGPFSTDKTKKENNKKK